MRIKVNNDLLNIINFITSYKFKLDWEELVNWCISSGYYEELYKNYMVILPLLQEHNVKFPKYPDKKDLL